MYFSKIYLYFYTIKMGTYVTVVGKHGLNISSVEEFAKDLSRILQKEIDIGYYDNFGVNSKGKIEYVNFQYKSLTNNTCASIQINDLLYSYRQYIQQYGIEEAKRMFKGSIFYDYLLTASKPYLNVKVFDKNREVYICDIYNDIMIDHVSDYGYNGWVFCQVFNGEDKGMIYANSVIEFRKEVKQYLSTFGVNEVFYLRDNHFAYDYKVIVGKPLSNGCKKTVQKKV